MVKQILLMVVVVVVVVSCGEGRYLSPAEEAILPPVAMFDALQAAQD